jgi:hypothetical protein
MLLFYSLDWPFILIGMSVLSLSLFVLFCFLCFSHGDNSMKKEGSSPEEVAAAQGIERKLLWEWMEKGSRLLMICSAGVLLCCLRTLFAHVMFFKSFSLSRFFLHLAGLGQPGSYLPSDG